jgi:undecaprenyl diphosphate synthase
MRTELQQLLATGTRLTVIGRRDRLPQGLRAEIARAEAASACGRRLHLQIAFDYSARAAIANAAAGWLADDSPSRDAFRRLLAWQGGGNGVDVDLLIRSGGEKRLSDLARFRRRSSARGNRRFLFARAALRWSLHDFRAPSC